MISRIVLMLALGLMCWPVSAGTLYVDVNELAEVDDPNNLYSNIQAAVDAAGDGDTILVADGTYTGPGNTEINPDGKAITIRSANGPTRCIIDCQGNEYNQIRAFTIVNYESQDTVIEGFTLTGGWINGGGSQDQHRGGGILIRNSSPTIRNCIVTGNYAKYGGGIQFKGGLPGVACLVENCTIHGNLSLAQTGGMRVTNGSQVILTNSIVWGNVSESDVAHEIELDDASALTLNYCILRQEDNTLLFEGDLVWGPGNSYDNPRFAQPGRWLDGFWETGDLHIRSTVGRWDDVNEIWTQDAIQGPGIDAGDPNSDYLEEYWPNGGVVNIGAYGGLVEASLSLDSNGVGDFDGDGNVDLRDLKVLTQHWLTTSKVWVGDMDLNGVVNMVDLSVLAYYWQRINTSPTPSKMAWASPPSLIEGYPNAVTMTAVTATTTDNTTVEYHFYHTGGDPNLDSGWLTFAADEEPTWEVYDLDYIKAYGFKVEARNQGNQYTTKPSETRSVITGRQDSEAPKPSPAEWETEPNVVGGIVQTMVAAEGTDNGTVYYKFVCFDSEGNELEAYNRDWMSEDEAGARAYTPSNLPKGSVYYFKVIMKDDYDNEGLYSVSEGMVDLKPPTPNPVTWDVTPHFTDNTIEDDETGYAKMFTMTVDAASDEESGSEGIEYYYECDTSAYSSSWQASNTYEQAIFSTYRRLVFQVKARDRYGNETKLSEAKSTSGD